MGGGAGITFTIKLSCAEFKFTGKTFEFQNAEVESFDAEGYMDGMTNVRGDLLKVDSIDIHNAEECAVWYSENGGNVGDVLTVYFDKYSDVHPHYIAFGGWIRGDFESLFPMTLEGSYTLDGAGGIGVSVTVSPAGDELKYWYSDVFETTFSEDDVKEYDNEREEDDDEITIDELYEMHREDTVANYGLN